MIYLRFPQSSSDRVQYAVIAKPEYSDVLAVALEKFYKASLAKQYAKKLATIMYQKMDFPKEGIYYLNSQTQTFFVFSKESNNWVNTNKSVDDYTIISDEIWESIFADAPFLKKVAEFIKSTVKKETSDMFNAKTWDYVESIDLATGTITSYGQYVHQIIEIFEDYFSVDFDFYLEVKKALSSTTSNNLIFLLENDILKEALSSEGTIAINDQAFDEIKQSLNEALDKKELDELINRLKNQILFAVHCKHEISFMHTDGNYSIKHHGLTLTSDAKLCGKYRVLATEQLLNAIAEAIRSNYSIRRYTWYYSSPYHLCKKDVCYSKRHYNDGYVRLENFGISICCVCDEDGSMPLYLNIVNDDGKSTYDFHHPFVDVKTGEFDFRFADYIGKELVVTTE